MSVPAAFLCNAYQRNLFFSDKEWVYKGHYLLPSFQNQIKSSLYSRYYAEVCDELRGPSPRLSAKATQLRRNVATVANRWRHCVDLTGPGIEPQTSRTDSVRFATELTADLPPTFKFKKFFNSKLILRSN